MGKSVIGVEKFNHFSKECKSYIYNKNKEIEILNKKPRIN